MNHKHLLFMGLLILISSCTMRVRVRTIVPATMETQALAESYDMAEDLAIFVHPTDLEKSMLIGANTFTGLATYDLEGQLLKHYPVGPIHRVDTRSDFKIGDETVHLVVASNWEENSLQVFKLDTSSMELTEINKEPIVSRVTEISGFCLYQNAEGLLYAFVTGREGWLEQWALLASGEKVRGELIRSFYVGPKCEGLVADDELGQLYITQRRRGIWKCAAEPDESQDIYLVDNFRNNSHIKKNLQGISLYYAPEGAGYLIVSSQGNDSYAVYRRQGRNTFLGSFKIGDGEVDGASESSGIAVTNLPLSSKFPKGLFIVQDAENQTDGLMDAQNFKMVDWEAIAQQYHAPLIIDTTYQKGQEEKTEILEMSQEP